MWFTPRKGRDETDYSYQSGGIVSDWVGNTPQGALPARADGVRADAGTPAILHPTIP
ncbi:hypothetical protein GCM10009602_52230 [Nocardiopsis tropica]